MVLILLVSLSGLAWLWVGADSEPPVVEAPVPVEAEVVSVVPAPDQALLREALSQADRWVVLESGELSERGVLEQLFVQTDATDLRRGAALRMVEAESRDWPADHRRGFLAGLAPAVLEDSIDHQVPPSITLAQAALESGWGRSGLATSHNNLFGVKAGASSRGVALNTIENVDGTDRVQKERFRTYGSWQESLEHHGALFSRDERYAHARDDWNDWREFLGGVAPVYATDPAYARRISMIVERYDLDRWDALVVDAVSRNTIEEASGTPEPGKLDEDGDLAGFGISH